MTTKSTDEMDKLIAAALSAQDRDILHNTEELGYFQQFGGKLGWVTWVIMLIQIALFLAGVWCAVQFFGASDLLLVVKYGISGAVLLLMSLIMKMSLWPQMQADRVIREVKRLQLLLASHQ
ncbi:hypothetical protein TL5118_02471 [Thalassovita autumnalis]|uniref:Uncharacterized protein n=1 Tax=Thalassovita autumnalis TaxID=2072972 RepID=A0A0P1GB65_9RHOB|nr:DUF6768 family protein [Thalassovita autumnalis]CUH68091.1 hypothetical protein TL5118_02471 [Thalassovita autumnalis]CUH73341.1 hypothetical protein TL5120_03149 [Thalassovita autumnalis]